MNKQQQTEHILRKKEFEAALAAKNVALIEKDKVLAEKDAIIAELQNNLHTANEQLSSYLLLTGTSITTAAAGSRAPLGDPVLLFELF